MPHFLVVLTGQGRVDPNGIYRPTTRPFVSKQARVNVESVSRVEDGKIYVKMQFSPLDKPFEVVFECSETKVQLEELMKGAS